MTCSKQGRWQCEMFKRMDYCEINRQLEYLIIIVETVTSPQLCCWTDRAPGLHSLSNSQFPVLCPSPGNGILLSLSRPSLLMFVARERRGGGVPPPTCGSGPLPTHCTAGPHCCLFSWRENILVGEREREEITHPTFLCSMPLPGLA